MASTASNHVRTATSITAAIHPDIIQTHILTKLDGPTLAAAACASRPLHALCTKEKLWQDICNSTWTSINDPRLRHVISTFPGGHRSFFSDSFPVLHSNRHRTLHHPDQTPELISAVDIHYKNKLVYSKVMVTDTSKKNFLNPTFWVDLLDPKESVAMPMESENEEMTILDLKQNMTLSWIVIDPTRKRAVNLSSIRPISVQPDWAPDDIRVEYVTVMSGDCRADMSEFVECTIECKFGFKERGVLEMKEGSLYVQDMDRSCLNGEDILGILAEAMENGKRKKGNIEKEKERHARYLDMKRERREGRFRRGRRLNMLWTVFWASIFVCVGLLAIFIAMFSR